MKREDVMRMAMSAGLLDKIDCSDHYFIPADAFIDEMEKLAVLAYEAGRKDENEACAEVCEGAYLSERTALFAAGLIRARREQ